MNAPYSFPSNFLPIGQQRLHYLDVGDGEPFLMVHGNPTWSFYYRHLVSALAEYGRCIVPDHIGCGFSSKPQLGEYGFRLRDRIDDLTTLMKHVNINDPITLIVHDWGGMIGLAWAMEQNIPIKRLVIFNTGGFPLPKTKPFPWRLWLGRNTKLGGWLIKNHNVFVRHAANIGTKRKPLPAEIRHWYVKPHEKLEDRTSVLKFVQTIPLKPTDDGYEIIQNVERSLSRYRDTPAIICWGMKDFVFDHHFLAEWERHLPNAEVHRFPDCGHYILEDATDEIIPLVKQFVERQR